MNTGNNKKKYPILFFLFVFAAIFIITIGLNLLPKNIFDITIPGEVIVNLYTVDNKLITVTDKDEFLVRDWNDIKARPVRIKSVENSILCYDQNTICTYSENNGKILLSDIKGQEKKRFNIGNDFILRPPKATRDGRLISFAAMSIPQDTENNIYKLFQLGIINTNKLEIESAYINALNNNAYYIRCFAITMDGSLFSVAGKKNNSDWIALFDMQKAQLLWEKTFPNDASSDNRINEITFSPDNKRIVMGLIDFHLYTFDSANGNVLNKRFMDYKRNSQKERIRISGLKFSHDGSFLAVGYEPPGFIWLWNLENPAKKPKKMRTRNTHISNIAFSNDSTKIASTGFTFVDKTLIWKIKK